MRQATAGRGGGRPPPSRMRTGELDTRFCACLSSRGLFVIEKIKSLLKITNLSNDRKCKQEPCQVLRLGHRLLTYLLTAR